MNDSIFISYADLQNLYQRLKPKIKIAAIIGALAVAAYRIVQPPTYVAEATFKQSSGKVEQNYDLKNFFRTLVQDTESSAASLMFSQKLLRRAIEDLGWQAHAASRTSSVIADNIKMMIGFPISDPDLFSFKDVHFDGEKPLSFWLRFESPDVYEILTIKETPLCKAHLGEKIEVDDASLTLEKTPKNFKIGKLYPLTVLPYRAVTSSVKGQFTIKPSPQDRSVLTLKFGDRSRDRATSFLNHIMAIYQAYLKEENQALADAQLKYLEKRQEELNGTLDKSLLEHVAYLKQTVGDKGFIGLHQEIEMLATPQENYNKQLFDIEFELSHLSIEEYSPTTFAQEYLQKRLDPIDQEFRNLVSQQTGQTEIELSEAVSLLEQVEKNETLLKPKNPTFASLIARLKNAPDSATASEAKQRLTAHLRDFIQSLHLKQKVLEEESFYAKTLESDFRGLDLDSARSLHVQYHTSLDSLHTGMKQLLYLRDHIDDPHCELGSLVSILPDGITQEMVGKASQLEFQLQDALNRSEKEHERYREALALQKQYIANHISHTIELQKIRAELTKEKIASLQQLMLDLLKREKKLIEDKLQDLKNQMAGLPEQWRLENLLKLKTDLAKGMMEGLTHLTESKVLNRHLYHVESRPLDAAFASPAPKPPRLLLFALFGAAAAAFFTYLAGFVKGIACGFPASSDTLKLFGEHTCGILSSLCDAPFSEIGEKDLETLRRVAAFLHELKKEKGLAVALLGEKNSNFSKSLASILAIRGKKTAILDCNFDGIVSSEDIPGLWQYLTAQQPSLNIRRLQDFDFVPSGGTTRHATELFTKDRFSSLILELQAEYDFILVTNRAPLSSAEALELAKHTDAAIVCFVDEPLDDLSFYRQKEKQNVTFVQQKIYTT